MNPINRLVLGTAALGLTGYGYGYEKGKVTRENTIKTIQYAWDMGIRHFDCSLGYGEIIKAFRIALKDKVDSRNKFNLIFRPHKQISLYLVRDVTYILDDDKQPPLDEDFFEFLGHSVYSPDEAWCSLQDKSVSAIQIPTSIADNRFVEGGIFKLAEELEKTIYVRSIFLQGKLLVQQKALNDEVIRLMNKRVFDSCCSPLLLCLGYLRDFLPESTKIIIGPRNPYELDQIVLNWVMLNTLDNTWACLPHTRPLRIKNENVIDPRTWKKEDGYEIML